MSYSLHMSWDDSHARLRKRLDTEHPPPYRNEVPFKVPAYLKELKPSQYQSHTVSLGLNSRLEPGLESCKAEFMRCFLKWKNVPASSSYYHPSVEVLYKLERFIAELQLDTDVKTARRWYEIDTGIAVQPEILKSMLALDALFLVLFLRFSYHKTKFPMWRLPAVLYEDIKKQTVFRHLAETRSGIWRDVFLFENQLPLHILLKVWKLLPDMENKPGSAEIFNDLLKEIMKDRYLELFHSVSDGEKAVADALRDKNFLECDHLLDCFHYVVCCTPPGKHDIDIIGLPDEDDSRAANDKLFTLAYTVPSATRLRKVGIRLDSSKTAPTMISDESQV